MTFLEQKEPWSLAPFTWTWQGKIVGPMKKNEFGKKCQIEHLIWVFGKILWNVNNLAFWAKENIQNLEDWYWKPAHVKGKNRDNAIKSNSEDQKCEARFGSWFEVHCWYLISTFWFRLVLESNKSLAKEIK